MKTKDKSNDFGGPEGARNEWHVANCTTIARPHHTFFVEDDDVQQCQTLRYSPAGGGRYLGGGA